MAVGLLILLFDIAVQTVDQLLHNNGYINIWNTPTITDNWSPHFSSAQFSFASWTKLFSLGVSLKGGSQEQFFCSILLNNKEVFFSARASGWCQYQTIFKEVSNLLFVKANKRIILMTTQNIHYTVHLYEYDSSQWLDKQLLSQHFSNIFRPRLS